MKWPKKFKSKIKLNSTDKNFLKRQFFIGLIFHVILFFFYIYALSNNVLFIDRLQVYLALFAPYLVFLIDSLHFRNIQKQNIEKNSQRLDTLVRSMTLNIFNIYQHYKLILEKVVHQNLKPGEKSHYFDNLYSCYNHINSSLFTYSTLADFDKIHGLLPGAEDNLDKLKHRIDQIKEKTDQNSISYMEADIMHLAFSIRSLAHDRPKTLQYIQRHLREIFQ